MTYRPICCEGKIQIGTGKVIIVTCWTPVGSFLNQYSGDWAAVGNLYSPAGLTYLARNLLANPDYPIVIFYLAKSKNNKVVAEAIKNFVCKGQLPKGLEDVPSEALADLFADLECFICTTIEDVKWAVNLSRPEKEIIREQFFYYPPTPKVKAGKGVYNGHFIKGRNVKELWKKVCHQILKSGKIESSRIELLNVLQILSGWSFDDFEFSAQETQEAEEYAFSLLDPSSEKEDGLSYTYGDRICAYQGKYNQLESVVSHLILNSSNTQSVISLWHPADLLQPEIFPPCLNQIWFRLQENKLYLTAVFRSHDIGRAYLKNLFALQRLHYYVLQLLRERLNREEIEPGEVAILSESAHLYLDNVKQVKEEIEERTEFYWDATGNFHIEIQHKEIIVVLMDTEGLPAEEFRGRKALKLGEKIVGRYPNIDPAHAIYLGQELQKAETAIAQDLLYQQDKELKQ